jgi:ribonuclease HII
MRHIRILGIDEAGKGPVIGPLVVCGFCCTEDEVKALKKIGVRDSKRISAKKREMIAEKLKNLGEYKILKISPDQLDEMMAKDTINEILYNCYDRIIAELKPDVVYVDSPDVIPERLSKRLKRDKIKVIAEHKADSKYPVVSAASILAKVERDAEISKLKKKFGDFGSGYASDRKTIDFLKKYLDKNGRFPPCARKSWKTLDKISQKSLTDFTE